MRQTDKDQVAPAAHPRMDWGDPAHIYSTSTPADTPKLVFVPSHIPTAHSGSLWLHMACWTAGNLES